jgi:hypothetical protein
LGSRPITSAEQRHLVSEVFDELGGSRIDAANTFDDVRQRRRGHCCGSRRTAGSGPAVINVD